MSDGKRTYDKGLPLLCLNKGGIEEKSLLRLVSGFKNIYQGKPDLRFDFPSKNLLPLLMVS